LGGDGSALVDELSAPAVLPSTTRILAEVENDTAVVRSQPRADVSAAFDGLAAARADESRAQATLLPRLNGFARYDWNSAARLYSGDRNWTVGIMASWSVFNGAGALVDLQETAGHAATAQAESEAATANARLEASETRTALAIALRRLSIAERALAQSAEAHRIVGRKYEGGLATVVELLEAQGVETRSGLALSQARWGAIVADAERRRALGLDPGSLAALEENSALAARDSLSNRR
ncbi:MAG: TolC family protein, partial [bacterium]